MTSFLLAAATLAAAIPSSAATLERPAFSLAYDAAIWRERAAVPPALATLDCVAAPCAGAVLQIIPDVRPLPRPGVTPFGPGALGLAVAPSRAVAPARRLILAQPGRPLRLASTPAVLSRFDVVAPDLGRSAMAEVLVPTRSGTLHLVLAAPALSTVAMAAFDDLLAGFRLQGG